MVYLAVEGHTDAAVAERLIGLLDLEAGRAIEAGGKSGLDPRIPNLNRSGRHLNWLILRDLDHDAPCASALIDRLVGRNLSPRVSLRIPIRALESWMLADANGFAHEFSVPFHHLPDRPDDLENPKQHLVNVCRRSRRSAIRQAMVPRPDSGRTVGPEHATRIDAFARRAWSPERAAVRSASLARTIAALRRLVAAGIWS